MMKAYAVRSNVTAEFVGFFVAASMDELRDLVDQCTDPSICEAAPVEGGGVYWPGKVPAVPLEDDEDLVTFGATVTQGSWQDALFTEVQWEAL